MSMKSMCSMALAVSVMVSLAGPALADDAGTGLIALRTGLVDPGAPGTPGWSADALRAGAGVAAMASGRVQPFLVQLDGPLGPVARTALEAAGARLVAVAPGGVCLVALEVAGLERLGRIERVRWVGPWLAAYKLEPALASRLAASGAGTVTVTLQTLTPEDVRAVAGRIGQGAGEVLEAVEGRRFGTLRARLTPALAAALAERPEVIWMERYLERRLWNDRAAEGPAMNVTNVWQAYGLTGSNQIIGHADTGLDLGDYGDMHPDLAGRVIFGVGLAKGLLGRGGAWNDPDGHGTHTAGSILGSGAASGGQYRGVAHEARLVHQSLIDKLGLLTGIPATLDLLFGQAYTNGARIHSDSWGSAGAGRYDTDAQQCDEFMWDHPDMLLVFAAGNEGIDGDANGVIDPTSIGSPASAKNLLCVGAAESGREPGSGGYSDRTYGSAWPTDYPVAPLSNDFMSASPPGGGMGLAAFSSRGPTEDGRAKPDLVATGTDVISARSRHFRAGVAWGELPGNSNYMFSGGTSMATPLTAGAAALVRQYYEQYAALTNPGPSAALIKATLMNGARTLSPGQYGTGVAREIPAGPRPNSAEGWGHVDLEQSLFPAPPRQLRFVEGASLATGESDVYEVIVGSAGRLSLTLAYTDYPGFPALARALINDLDLWLETSAGVTNRPNGGGAADRLNNVETIDLAEAAPGTYRLVVSGFDVPAGIQPYALVMTGAAEIQTTTTSTSSTTSTSTTTSSSTSSSSSSSTTSSSSSTSSTSTITPTTTSTTSVPVTSTSSSSTTAPAPVPLAEALDWSVSPWLSGGVVGWVGHPLASRNGSDAARSGGISHGQESWLQTAITGPTTVGFWWRLSAETNDTLTFVINGAAQFTAGGAQAWRWSGFTLPAGVNTLRWTYAKNGSGTAGDDAAFVDGMASGLWGSARDTSDGWRYSAWYGYVLPTAGPWHFHWQHGWQYVFGTTPASLPLWDAEMQAYWWTAEGIYPYVYRYGDGAWLWYQPDSDNPRVFLNTRSGVWEKW